MRLFCQYLYLICHQKLLPVCFYKKHVEKLLLKLKFDFIWNFNEMYPDFSEKIGIGYDKISWILLSYAQPQP